MSSGLIYGFQHLADHPEVYSKIKEEQDRVRQGNFTKPLTLEMLDQMTYLQAAVKESMRVMPPVLMVRVLLPPFYPASQVSILVDRCHIRPLAHSLLRMTITYLQAP